jgi:hypothetical protein
MIFQINDLIRAPDGGGEAAGKRREGPAGWDFSR